MSLGAEAELFWVTRNHFILRGSIWRIWFIFTAILADHDVKVVIGFFVDLKENFFIMVYNVYCVATFWLNTEFKLKSENRNEKQTIVRNFLDDAWEYPFTDLRDHISYPVADDDRFT